MMDDFAALAAERGEGVGVVRVEGGKHPGPDCGRGVQSYGPACRTRPLGGEPFGRTWNKLLEAGERLGVVVDVALLPAREPPVGSERPEHEQRPLERARATAQRARVRPA